MIVGEGGCSPEYFMKHMGFSEAQRYIRGLNRRQRSSWEQTRTLTKVYVKAMTGKDFDFDLPWDEKEEKQQATPEELDAVRAKARQLEKLLNGKI